MTGVEAECRHAWLKAAILDCQQERQALSRIYEEFDSIDGLLQHLTEPPRKEKHDA